MFDTEERMSTSIESGVRLPLYQANVWIVEDDDTFRSSLVALLLRDEQLHCERAFSNCEDAIHALQRDHAPEILLSDIVLPGMDGIEGTKRIKAISPSTHVMMLTNYADDDKIFKAICAGASGYLLKTATSEEIERGIQEVMKGGAPMTAQIARKVLDKFAETNAPKGSYGLTQREREILNLLVKGLTKKQMAARLFLSTFTIETHLKNIYTKLQVHTSSGAVSKVITERLL